jgi:hypothetical protein
MNVRIVKWNQIYTKGVTLSTSTKINTLLFTNDQVITADSDDNLQTEVFAQILGILNITFKPTLVQKSSRIKVYSAVAVPILLYGSEFWTLRKKDKKYQLR